MFCEKCGAQLGAGMKFCTACGAPVGVSEPEQGASAPVNNGGTGAVNDLMNSYYRAAQGTQPSAAPASAPVQPGVPVQGAAFPQGAQPRGIRTALRCRIPGYRRRVRIPTREYRSSPA